MYSEASAQAILSLIILLQLAGVSDSGVSQTDGITNVRQLQFNGLTGANAAVSLFANNQLVGTTTAAANGTWQIVTAAMEDGSYDVLAQVKSPNGVISNRSLGQQLVVDTIAPETVVNGLVDGVAWTPQTVISGVIADPDSQLRVEYQINSDGTTAVSAVMGATIDGWALARNLAIETKITSLQMFEANLYLVSLAALKQNGMSGVSATDLKIAIDSLALNYAILRPSEASKGYGQPLSTGDFLGNLWNNGKDYISWHRSVYGGGSNYLHTPELEAGRWNIKDAIADLAQHLQGQANPLQALRMVDRMLQAATQVSQLHQDGFVGTTPGWYTARRTY
jgi:hypothetical protein